MYNLSTVSAAVIITLTFTVSVGALQSSPLGLAQEQPAVPGELSLQEAIKLALSSEDPYLMEPGEQAAAFDDRAVSDSQLPDPKLRMTFANWPKWSQGCSIASTLRDIC